MKTRDMALVLVISVVPSHFFSGLAGVLSAVHNQERRFFLTSLATFSVSLVTLAALSFAGTLDLKALVLAANAGPLCQSLVLLAPLAKDLPEADLETCREQFAHFTNRGAFLLISQFFGQSSQPVIRALSSMLPSGSVSHFAYGDRLFSAYSAFFSQPFSTIVLPALSDSAARGHEELQRQYSRVCRLSLFIAAPVVSLWVLLPSDAVAILYEHGKFSSADASTVMRILRLYGVQVYLSMAAAPLAPVLYSAGRGDVAGRLWIAVGISNMIIGYILTRFFGTDGLAITYGIVWLLASAFVLSVIDRQLALRPEETLWTLFAQSCMGAALGIVAAIGVSWSIDAWLPAGVLGHILRLGQRAAAVLGVYIAVMWMLGSREMSYLARGMSDAFSRANRR
jgi:putative peptidoglycan lipid II flippase